MLKFIGTGSAFNTKLGNTSAYMKLGNELIILDMGEDVFAKAKNMNLFEGVSKVHFLITHLHSDHVGSLGSAIAYLYYSVFNMDNSKICVYFPSESITKLLAMVGVTTQWYTFFINRWDELEIDGYEKKVEYIFEENEHTSTLDVDNKSNCYSIELVAKDVFSIYYSGDCAGFKERLRNYWNYDYIYHEVTNNKLASVHTYYEELLAEANKCGKELLKRIYLMHLDEDFDADKARKDGFNIAMVENN